MTAYFFGNVEVRPSRRKVLVDKRPAQLGARAFDVLMVLLENPGRLVTKGELLDAVWRGQSVTEHNLVVQVSTLRSVLGRSAIVTVPGRGYRFVAELLPDTRPTASVATPPPAMAVRTNLPQVLEPLIGRAADAAMLAELVRQNRLVTVIGAGGIGKSQLAQQLLHEQRGDYPNGVAWVELAGLCSAAHVGEAIARGLDVQLGSGDAQHALTGALAPLEMLIGLDNAEHVVDEVARLVPAILSAAPGVRLIVTSQVPLNAAFEHVMRLDPLALPDPTMTCAEAAGVASVALFVKRTQALQRDFVLDEHNVSSVIEICRRLDGLPLAIQLAAARVPLLGVTGIVKGLDEQLRLLGGGRRHAPPRQRTLRAALEWSVSLLSLAERLVLRRLGVFAGTFAMDMAQQVAADPERGIDQWAVLDVLGALVERSLVVALRGEPLRYRLLESTRALALEELEAVGETGLVSDRHLDTVLARLTRGYEDRYSGRRPFDLVGAWLDPDIDNARSAMLWALKHRPALAVALVYPLHTARPGGHFAESRDLWDATESLLNSGVEPLVLARWMSGSARFWARSHPDKALASAQQAIVYFRQHGPDWELFSALQGAAAARLRQAATTELAELCEMESLVTESAPTIMHYWAAWTRANALHMGGDPAGALRCYRKAKRLGHTADHAAAAWRTAVAIADLALLVGDVDGAVRQGEELVGALRLSRQRMLYPYALLNLACAWLARGAYGEARQALLEALPLAFREFDHRTVVSVHLSLFAALSKRGDASGRFLGYCRARVAVTGSELQGNEAAAQARAQALARNQLGRGAFEEALAAGKAMSDAEIELLARCVLDASNGSPGWTASPEPHSADTRSARRGRFTVSPTRGRRVNAPTTKRRTAL